MGRSPQKMILVKHDFSVQNFSLSPEYLVLLTFGSFRSPDATMFRCETLNNIFVSFIWVQKGEMHIFVFFWTRHLRSGKRALSFVFSNRASEKRKTSIFVYFFEWSIWEGPFKRWTVQPLNVSETNIHAFGLVFKKSWNVSTLLCSRRRGFCLPHFPTEETAKPFDHILNKTKNTLFCSITVLHDNSVLCFLVRRGKDGFSETWL